MPEKTSSELLAELRKMGEFIPMSQSARYATLLSQLEYAIKVETEQSETSNQESSS